MKTLIAIPAMSTVPTDFLTSILGLYKPEGTHVAVLQNSLVHSARNQLVWEAIKAEDDYILWIDSDMVFAPDMAIRLLKDAEEGRDYVTALCFARALPTVPCIAKSLVWSKADDGIVTHEAEIYEDYPQNRVFEIAASGAAACLVRTDLYKRVIEEFRTGPYEPLPQFGEDYSFCWRLNQMGIKMYCDSSVKLGHIYQYTITENAYLIHRQREAEVKLP